MGQTVVNIKIAERKRKEEADRVPTQHRTAHDVKTGKLAGGVQNDAPQIGQGTVGS
jgi:hypothetical protein